jgi:hypothetical protein
MYENQPLSPLLQQILNNSWRGLSEQPTPLSGSSGFKTVAGPGVSRDHILSNNDTLAIFELFGAPLSL